MSPQQSIAHYRIGTKIAYVVLAPHVNAGYWVAPLEGGNPPKSSKPVRLAQGTSNSFHGAFSPDGKWFAYSLHDGSLEQVFITDGAGRGRRFQVSSSGSSVFFRRRGAALERRRQRALLPCQRWKTDGRPNRFARR
jgi:Tol biopolymer transport system component